MHIVYCTAIHCNTTIERDRLTPDTHHSMHGAPRHADEWNKPNPDTEESRLHASIYRRRCNRGNKISDHYLPLAGGTTELFKGMETLSMVFTLWVAEVYPFVSPVQLFSVCFNVCLFCSKGRIVKIITTWESGMHRGIEGTERQNIRNCWSGVIEPQDFITSSFFERIQDGLQ